jgi:hypothetical protein
MPTAAARSDLLAALYEAFNARRIDAVLEHLSDDVDWANAWEGGRLRGKEAVRGYWTRQWSEIDPTVEPRGFTPRTDDTVAVQVHQTIRGLDGSLLGEGDVTHVFRFDGELIARMDVES